jgi:hypothetical protein
MITPTYFVIGASWWWKTKIYSPQNIIISSTPPCSVCLCLCVCVCLNPSFFGSCSFYYWPLGCWLRLYMWYISKSLHTTKCNSTSFIRFSLYNMTQYTKIINLVPPLEILHKQNVPMNLFTDFNFLLWISILRYKK